jgi:hypothetical protein
MAINNVALTTTAANIFVNTSGTSAITTIHLCNYSSGAVTANIYAVPAGGIAGSSTIIYSNVTITSDNTLIINAEKFILGSAGDRIMANVSANSTTTATVSSIGI